MSEYSGTANLEVMDDAVNYNAYLSSLVRMHASPQDRILDFGAGIGTHAIPLRTGGFDVSCIETDPIQLLRLTQHGLPSFSDLAALPDDTYDYIFTLNVLEHIQDDQATLRNLASKLKHAGRLLVYVPAFPILFSSMDRKVGHYRRYRLQGLARQLRLAGFDVKEARYVDSLGFVASLIYKWIDRNDGSLNRSAVVLFDRLVFPISRVLDRVTGRWFGKNLLIFGLRQ